VEFSENRASANFAKRIAETSRGGQMLEWTLWRRAAPALEITRIPTARLGGWMEWKATKTNAVMSETLT